jgi:hypothetical protein
VGVNVGVGVGACIIGVDVGVLVGIPSHISIPTLPAVYEDGEPSIFTHDPNGDVDDDLKYGEKQFSASSSTPQYDKIHLFIVVS